ncbi:MAG: hypothetical protein GFH27_549281n69 [Chloroflexi bacterium AL-W]|nr:hypothetical protein [Chloroflexi bacterium AL-N1]NOK65955.1 hypothetical protein [Chloroflexi bacterium AL-N10]NOK72836.1 hypothetical protein [Chloroflexi bacterium AL-N5]NOK79733.1 hypothetical protein [Chloroflexi bacterium AL-W]NOK88411.1 hypothetical protein [Chloroflexi bacterium AL-N15]
MSRHSTLRRAPQQKRGQQRVDRILDAAAQVFADVGYEAATTNAIAAQAQTSIGSLYQFFPNKDAIVSALVARYVDQLRTVYDSVLEDQAEELSLEITIGRLVDGLIDFHLTHTGFMAIFTRSPVSEQAKATAEELAYENHARGEQLLGMFVPNLPDKKRHLYALIASHIVKGLMPLSDIQDEHFRAAVANEIKVALLAYLESIRERFNEDTTSDQQE